MLDGLINCLNFSVAYNYMLDRFTPDLFQPPDKSVSMVYRQCLVSPFLDYGAKVWGFFHVNKLVTSSTDLLFSVNVNKKMDENGTYTVN